MEAMPSFQSQLVELESIWEICRGEDERKHALITVCIPLNRIHQRLC